jgi:hypothetical protein
MCVIVDVNVASEVFRATPSERGVPIRDWVINGDGCFVFGGQLADELFRYSAARRFLIELGRQGRAARMPRDKIEAETKRLRAIKCLASDDPHVIALARVSGARVLFSSDTDLHGDFKNSALVANPRGRVYTSKTHRRLLHHDASCGLKR